MTSIFDWFQLHPGVVAVLLILGLVALFYFIVTVGDNDDDFNWG